MANHNSWAACEKTISLPTILKGQDADILHSVPAGAVYKHITEALKRNYGDHQLVAVYQSQQKVKTQLTVHS
jgi:hypothetical protein